MQIVVTNDDGWGAKGLQVLIKLMCQLGEVTVVVPDGVRSSMSNAISMNKVITFRPLDYNEYAIFTDEERQHLKIYLTNGTPSDCVKLALNNLFDGDANKIDLLVSGINHGSNSSINIIYSGTMGACFVAAEQGIKSIGFSIMDDSSDADFSFFASHIPNIVDGLLKKVWIYGLCYNVNAPKGQIYGIRYTCQGRGHWENEIEQRKDENGDTFYWLVGNYVNDEQDNASTDENTLSKGYISIQPCTIDMTNYAVYEKLHKTSL